MPEVVSGSTRFALPSGAEELYLISDGDHVIIERTASATQRTYIWAGATLLKSRATGGVELHLYQDRLGSVVLATKRESGSTAMHGRAQYDPYGNNISTGAWSGVGVGQPYGYTGARWDSVAGLYLMGARWYAPEMGRFVELDPIGEGGGWNLYNYVGSSPTMWVDPTGLKWQGIGPPAHIQNPRYASSASVSWGGSSGEVSPGIVDGLDFQPTPKVPRSPIPCYVCNNADETGDSGGADEANSEEQESGACEGAEVAAERPDERLAQVEDVMTTIAKEHGQQNAGKGRAVVDFTKNYLIDDKKLEGGNAWDAMNRSMVQDVLNAQCHRKNGTSPNEVKDPAVSSWMSFANNPTDDTFWRAHDESLYKGLASKEVQEQRGNLSPQDRNAFDAMVDRALYVEDGLRIGEGILQQAEWHMQRQGDGLVKSIAVDALEAGRRLLHSMRDSGGPWVGAVATGYSVFY